MPGSSRFGRFGGSTWSTWTAKYSPLSAVLLDVAVAALLQLEGAASSFWLSVGSTWPLTGSLPSAATGPTRTTVRPSLAAASAMLAPPWRSVVELLAQVIDLIDRLGLAQVGLDLGARRGEIGRLRPGSPWSPSAPRS